MSKIKYNISYINELLNLVIFAPEMFFNSDVIFS